MRLLSLIILLYTLVACTEDQPETETGTDELKLTYVFIGARAITSTDSNLDVAVDKPIEIRFESPVSPGSAETHISLVDINNKDVELDLSFQDNNQLLTLSAGVLIENTTYTLKISNLLIGAGNEAFEGLELMFTTLTIPLVLEKILIDGTLINPKNRVMDIGFSPEIELYFNRPVTAEQITGHSGLDQMGTAVSHSWAQLDASTLKATANVELSGYKKYRLRVADDFSDEIGRPFDGLDLSFYTRLDSTSKFPEIPDEELLTKIQQQTFKYFWDFGHPVSGLSRERNTSGETVTIGGSGFGVMAILVGIERGFITRQQGVNRLETIVTFLDEKADRFHGAWSHWLNGSTGKAISFSANDDGADLVETAFMIQGLLAAREYLNTSNTQESNVIEKINKIWSEVEWDWFTRNGQNVLYWHWSPNFGWEKNHKITGWNEAMIVYVLAAASPTHSIDKAVYDEGWTRSGAMVNSSGVSHYDITMPLRSDMGGPLFFSHYSFLGLDPRKLSDSYANYWQQNVNHSLINQAYCADNPQKHVGYTSYSWGLTASDNHQGYNAHSPNNDLGVITPTAAISSLPYAPEQSMAAIRHFYYILGDRLWGEYGFYDAFNITEDWYADSYLAIDQGPILLMIENHRSGFLWDLFMTAPEIKNGLKKLNFTYE